MNVVADAFTGCLSSRFVGCVELDHAESRTIRDYRPQMPEATWARVCDQVRAVVAAALPTVGYEARNLMNAVAHLAAWADGAGLPADPGRWLRTETIDLFVLRGCPGLSPGSVLTVRSQLRRVREALVWVERGEAPSARISAPRSLHLP